MPLLGSAAMLLAFDIDAEAIAEHDDWHTHEHLPERLSIPGFLRGTRWVAVQGQPRYCVLYEVAHLATLRSPAYLERLNNPTPWTSKMMPHYRGMTRGLCGVTASYGLGMGNTAYVVRFTPSPDAGPTLRSWLVHEVLPGLAMKPGAGSAHLLQGAVAAPMTAEQRIRGTDAAVDAALVLVGYDAGALLGLKDRLVGRRQLERRGAVVAAEGAYRLDYVLTRDELKSERASARR